MERFYGGEASFLGIVVRSFGLGVVSMTGLIPYAADT